MIKKATITALLICSFIPTYPKFEFNTIQEGFAAGTLVKTPSGCIPIENLKIGDTVIGFNDGHEHLPSTVTHSTKIKIRPYVKLVINDEIVYTGLNQKFYFLPEKSWIKAQDLLRAHTFLTNNNQPSAIQEIQIIDEELDGYCITVESHHFFVTTTDIGVHNMADLAFAAAAATKITVEAIVVGVTAIGGLIYKFVKNKQRKKSMAQQIQEQYAYSMPIPPDDDEEFKRRHPNGKYKDDAKYHHPNSSGQKSPAPKNGQKALDNSFQIKDTSPNRIGVSEGEIVMLYKTAEGVYHGFVVSWEYIGSLGVQIQRKLIENGLTNKKGLPIL